MDLIYLNGPSGAGKTLIARELQGHLPDYYMYVGVDAFMEIMPPHSNCGDRPSKSDGFSWIQVPLPNGDKGKRVVAGQFGKQVEESFREICLTLLKSGYRLIVDNADGLDEITHWRTLFRGYSTCFVGVFCSLDLIVQREAERPDRMPGSSAEQYVRVHEGIDYDLTVDTTDESPESCAEKIARYVAERR